MPPQLDGPFTQAKLRLFNGAPRRVAIVLLVIVCAAAPDRLEAASIFEENSLPGAPASEWDVQGIGDPSIQGFATDISVNHGQTISFKIATAASAYRIDIYRLGYYGGLGARKVATVTPSAVLPQTQPACITQSTTRLVDCGNWVVSASWDVPVTATSGVYIARPVRSDTGGASHIIFIVRDDSSQSEILFQTSDTTWHAYNNYGGINLYRYGTVPPYRAYKVSYNRPFNNRGATSFGESESFLFDSEYPMIRWLEANGYDVSYAAGVDTDRRGAAALTQHKAFMSVGHDEYWSGQQRANVEAARDAGVHLGFFSGNEVFWKTRWENSIAGVSTSYRTLVCYKETLANAKIDPSPSWTGTFRDPRFSPPSDGGRPETSLTGQLYSVDVFRLDPMRVSSVEGKLRFWRNTGLDALPSGQTAELPAGVLGFEWNEVVDNGLIPPGLVRLSTTSLNVDKRLQDYASTYVPGVATHSLTLYRHSSGAIVFAAGSIRWSWGLDALHDKPGPAADVRMQQATVNLLADMGIQPVALQPGLLPATESTDGVAPTSVILTPVVGTSVAAGSSITVAGTATDSGGGRPAGVQFSVDGGAHWRLANGGENWSGTWTPTAPGTYTITSRAVDDSGRIETPGSSIEVTVGPPLAIMKLNFDDGAGATATDASGLGNAGTLLRGPVWTDGTVGGALSFDGQDDMVTVANSPSIRALTQQVTVSAWVYRAAAQANWATVISRQLGSSPFYYEHWFLGFSDTGQYRWFVNTTVGYSSTALGGAAPVGQWVHLVGTYDGAMVRLYVNGVQQFATAQTGTLRTDTTGLTIGASVNDSAQTPAEAFNGRIDHVRVFNVALDASQVQELFSGTHPPPDTTMPGVTNVTSSTADGSYRVGATVALRVSFDEPVRVTGIPQLMLETGITDGVARYASGNGTATLTFNYFVKSGDYSSDLDYVSWGSLVLSGGTIRDTAGNAARLTLLPPGTPGSLAANKALVLDTTAPQVPTGLTAMAGPGGVALQWTAPTDNVGVTGYRIYRFGVLAGSSTGASFQEAGLLANTIYRYRVSALDAAGNESVRSVPLDVTTRPANPGEILRLSLEEGSGTVAGDGSGQGNNGTLLRGPVWTTGASGGALAFDGRDDAVFVANSSSIATLTTQVSVAAWVYRAGAQANWAAVISRQVGSSPFNLEHWWLGFSGKGQYRWFVNTTAGYSSTALGGTAPVGQWVHLVGTYDGAMVRLYVNGVQQFATPETGTFPADTTGLMIGASVNDEAQTAVEAFNGRIDQVGVYNVALTASQVQSLYAGTLP